MADDIYSLAQQAGMVPQGNPDAYGLPAGGPIPASTIPGLGLPTSTLQGAFPDPLQHEDPAVQATDPTQGIPAQGVPAPEGAAVLPPGTSQGSSSSVSHTGTNFSTLGKLDKRDGQLEAAKQASDAETSQQYDPAIAARQAATQEEHAAINKVTDASVAQIGEEGRSALALKTFNDGVALDETRAQAALTAKEDAAKADYTTALADFRASRVNPTQLWDNTSGGGKFGLMVSAFVQDFLGSKGVKTSAMATINQAIDRNIDSQIQNIKIKGEALDGFKTLWEMQRAQSASETEARSRIKGFMLESLKQGITANMAQFKSGLASAQGQSALAAVDKEYANNLIDVYKHISDDATARRGQVNQWAIAKVQAAADNYRTSVSARAQKLAEKEYADKQKAVQGVKSGDIIIDPESNQGKWVFKAGVSDTEKAKTHEQLAGIKETAAAMQELRDLDRRGTATVVDGVGITRWSDQDIKKYDAAKKRLVHGMVKAAGERATDKDFDQFASSIPQRTLTGGSVDELLADTQAYVLSPAYANLQQVADDLPPEMWTQGAKNVPFSAGYTDAKASSKAGASQPAASPVSKAAATMAQPDKHDAAAESVLRAAESEGLDPYNDYVGYLQAYEGKHPTTLPGGATHKFVTHAGESGDPAAFEQKVGRDEVPAYAVALARLAGAKDDEAATNKLHDYAFPDTGGGVLPDGTDPNSEEGQAMRAFALYEWAHRAGIK